MTTPPPAEPEQVPPPHTRWATVVKTSLTFWKDFRERAWSTAWQAFLATLIGAQPTTDWSGIKSLAISAVVAAGAAVLSMGKSLVVRNRGVKDSASADKAV
jgi:hypothetical protein